MEGEPKQGDDGVRAVAIRPVRLLTDHDAQDRLAILRLRLQVYVADVDAVLRLDPEAHAVGEAVGWPFVEPALLVGARQGIASRVEVVGHLSVVDPSVSALEVGRLQRPQSHQRSFQHHALLSGNTRGPPTCREACVPT